MSDPNPWIVLLRDVGFPVAVAAYLLWRVEPKLSEINRRLTMIALILAASAHMTQEEVDRVQKLSEPDIGPNGPNGKHAA